MARKTCIDLDEVQKAKQLRDQATTVSEYRKALSVILVAEYGFDADRVANTLGISRRTVFRDGSNLRNQDETSKRTWGGRRNFSTAAIFTRTEPGRTNLEHIAPELFCQPSF